MGEVWQKWAWRIVLYDPGDVPIRAEVRVELKSNEDFIIDSSEKGNVPVASENGSRLDALIARYGQNDIFLYPRETQVIQGTSSYNTAERQGEGEPAQLDLHVICAEAK